VKKLSIKKMFPVDPAPKGLIGAMLRRLNNIPQKPAPKVRPKARR
jgi:hypothetical protein